MTAVVPDRQRVAAPVDGPRAAARRRRLTPERFAAPVILLPTLIAVAVFVYAFIAITIWVSMSNWDSLQIDLSLRDPLYGTYTDMFAMRRFQAGLRNTFVFTVLFLTVSVGGGLLLAIVLHHSVLGRGFFRSLFLFPYALSFVVTGVVWRWLFNPETGINLLFDAFGVNAALQRVGVGPLQPGWLTDGSVALSVNDGLARIFPRVAEVVQVELGIPVALIPVVVAAGWQLSGFAMAMYLAGLATVPEELREAALVDGASTWQAYRRIIIPVLAPITISNLVLLGYISLKIFDLIFVMSGSGPNFATEVPGIFVFEQTFNATRYNLGAAASVVMLILVSAVVIPYLARNMRSLT